MNFLKQGDTAGTSFVNLDSPVSMPRVLDKSLEQALPFKSSPDPHRSFGRGVACAMPMFDVAALPSLGLLGAGVSIQLMSDGTLKVYSTAVEMGQGVTTVLTQIAMEEFGLSSDEVSVVLGDTDISQKSGPSTASRQTYVSGNALLAALKKLKARVSQKAGALLEEDPGKLLFRDSEILSPEGDKAMTLAEVAKTCYYEGVDLREKSWFKATHAMIGHTFMATVADVEVDLKTGAVYIKRLINCHDIGRAINPEAVRGQLVGGGIQSLGWSLQEEFITEEGMTKTPSFSEYLVPTAMDIPAVETYLIEEPYPTGPYGAKGVGEHATICATPAIVSAINNATGHFFRDIPLTSEKIYWALGNKPGE
jgi:CO/xanthine dehydrogenase Mo-binding subunit